MNDIFVSIPTMNDSEYVHTVERIFDLAKYPGKVKIGTSIFWKFNDLDDDSIGFIPFIINKIKNNKNIKYDVLPWELYPGVGMGRTEPLKHYNNEKYYLSIDSHTDFVKDWDIKLIDQYENSKKSFGSRRVLTSYLPGYYSNYDEQPKEGYTNKYLGDSSNDSMKTLYDNNDKYNRWQFFTFHSRITKTLYDQNYIFPTPNDRFINDNYQILENLIEDFYLPAKKISAHFTFTEANPWVTRDMINLDPGIDFWAEEYFQSALAYARGYNFVWPKKPVIFHHYTGINGSVDRKIKEKFNFFDKQEDKEKFYKNYINKFNFFENINRIDQNQIIKKLFDKNNDWGYLPRSINGFNKYAKIDLINKKCSPWWEVPELNVIYK